MIAFVSLLRALEFIERNLMSPFSAEDLAGAAYLSVSQLNRLFARVFRQSPVNYVLKRRLCRAAKELSQTERPITDIALDAQFSAPESFSRAFKRQFLLSPAEYRKRGIRFHELYPPITLALDAKGGIDMSQGLPKRYDRSQLHEKILSSKGTFILMIDADHLMQINEKYGHPAGDAAIAAIASRIERALEPGMLFFRTGGDEFTALTFSRDLALCEAVAQKILSFADEDIPYPGGSYRITLSAGVALIPDDLSDPDIAIERADAAMLEAKHAGRGTYRVLNG
jgi:AraC family transcriptional regulator